MKFNTYIDEIAAEIGARPKLFKSLLFDRALGNRLLLAPIFPIQFRIWGRHAIQGARERFLKDCTDHSEKTMTITDVSSVLRLGILVTAAAVLVGTVAMVRKWN